MTSESQYLFGLRVPGCSVLRDAGDDPDVTHSTTLVARVQATSVGAR